MDKKKAKKILHETLGNYIEKGSELLFSCPSCGHHKRKFSINLDKSVYKCWVCDYRGRNIRRIVRSYGSYNQLQKWDSISERSDLERFAELFMETEPTEDKSKVELPEEFTSLSADKVPATGTYALRYLQKRGVTRDDILKMENWILF
jgi:rubrerythrin